jgi:hypothetical protein
VAGIKSKLSLRQSNTQILGVGKHRLHLIRKGTPEIPAEITVVEDDTWQLMSAENHLAAYSEHPVRLMTELIDQKPVSTGTVLRRNNHWKIIIYDLDKDPISRTEWIELAFINLLSETRKPVISSLSMPLPGCSHGPVNAQDSLEIVINSLAKWQSEQPLLTHLVCSPEQYESLCNNLQSLFSHNESLVKP